MFDVFSPMFHGSEYDATDDAILSNFIFIWPCLGQIGFLLLYIITFYNFSCLREYCWYSPYIYLFSLSFAERRTPHKQNLKAEFYIWSELLFWSFDKFCVCSCFLITFWFIMTSDFYVLIFVLMNFFMIYFYWTDYQATFYPNMHSDYYLCACFVQI